MVRKNATIRRAKVGGRAARRGAGRAVRRGGWARTSQAARGPATLAIAPRISSPRPGNDRPPADHIDLAEGPTVPPPQYSQRFKGQGHPPGGARTCPSVSAGCSVKCAPTHPARCWTAAARDASASSPRGRGVHARAMRVHLKHNGARSHRNFAVGRAILLEATSLWHCRP